MDKNYKPHRGDELIYTEKIGLDTVTTQGVVYTIDHQIAYTKSCRTLFDPLYPERTKIVKLSPEYIPCWNTASTYINRYGRRTSTVRVYDTANDMFFVVSCEDNAYKDIAAELKKRVEALTHVD